MKAAGDVGDILRISRMGRVAPALDSVIRAGVAQFNQGRQKEAINRFSAAIRKRPGSACAYLFRALAYQSIGSRSAAARDIDRAVRCEAGSAGMRLRAARMLKDLGRTQAALNQCGLAIQLAPRSRAAREAQVMVEGLAGGDGAGEERLREAIALAPASARLRLRLARGLREEGRLEAALNECEAAAGLAPRSPSAHQLAYDLQRELGLRAEAILSLRRVVAGEPRSTALRLWAAAALKEMGEFDGALSQLRAASRLDGHSIQAYCRWGDLSLWRGDIRRAALCADRALDLEPACAQALRVRGAALVLRRRFREAVEDLSAAISLAPQDGQARIWRAEAFRHLKSLSRASADIEGALALEGRSVAVLINRALIEIARRRKLPARDWDEIFGNLPWRQLCLDASGWPSRDLLEKILGLMLGNRSPAATFARGAAGLRAGRRRISYAIRVPMIDLQGKIRFGDVDRVLRQFDILIEKSPREPYLHASRGEVCLWAGRYADALADIERARRLNGRLPWPPIGLCAVHALRGDYGEALKELECAARNGASPAAMRTWKGEIYRRSGDPARASFELAQAPEALPFRPALWLNLALSLGDLGDFRAQWRLYRRLEGHLPEFIADAARECGFDQARPHRGPSDGETGRILEKALDLMKGNRSSWMYTYVLNSGRVKLIKIHGVRTALVPPGLAHNAWMFHRDGPAGQG